MLETAKKQNEKLFPLVAGPVEMREERPGNTLLRVPEKYFTQRSLFCNEDTVYSTYQVTRMPLNKGWLEQNVLHEVLLGYHQPGKKLVL